MKEYLKCVCFTLLALFLALASWSFYELSRAVRSERAGLASIHTKLDSVLSDLSTTARIAKEASEKNAEYYGLLGRQTADRMVQLKSLLNVSIKLVEHEDKRMETTHRELNTALKSVASLSETLDALKNLIKNIDEQNRQQFFEQFTALTSQAVASLEAASDAIQDPEVHNILVQMRKDLEELQKIGKPIEDLGDMTGKLNRKLDDILKPMSLLKRLLFGALDVGSKGRMLINK